MPRPTCAAPSPTLTAEGDAARGEIEGERTHGDRRVQNLRTGYERQVDQLRDELAQVRAQLSTAREVTGDARRSHPRDSRG